MVDCTSEVIEIGKKTSCNCNFETAIIRMQSQICELNTLVRLQHAAIKQTNKIITQQILPQLNKVPEIIKQYRDECPVYQALTEQQKEQIMTVLKSNSKEKVTKEQITIIQKFAKLIDNQIVRWVFLILAGIAALVLNHFFGGV